MTAQEPELRFFRRCACRKDGEDGQEVAWSKRFGLHLTPHENALLTRIADVLNDEPAEKMLIRLLGGYPS